MIADRSIVRAAHIILASSSPRRVDILNNVLGLQAEVIPSTFPEDLDKSRFTPAEYVAENAKQKALEVYSRQRAKGETRSLIVGADTVVVVHGELERRATHRAKQERHEVVPERVAKVAAVRSEDEEQWQPHLACDAGRHAAAALTGG